MKTRDAVYQEWFTDDGQLHAQRMGELIRCKDCKYYDGRPCGNVDWYNTANDFCSRAERKEE